MEKNSEEGEGAETVLGACPSAAALRQVSGRWSLEVVAALRGGPLRTQALLRLLRGVSAKVLSETLRGLVSNDIVRRTELSSRVKHVEYALTAQGQALTAALSELDGWAVARQEELRSARAPTSP